MPFKNGFSAVNVKRIKGAAHKNVDVDEALLLTIRYLLPHDISRNTRRDLQDEHDAEQDGKLKRVITFHYTSNNNSILAYRYFYVVTALPKIFRENRQNIHESLVAH